MGYSFYWAMMTSMQVDILIGAWPSLKALEYLSFWGIICSLILALLLLNYFFYIVVVTRGFFDFYLPKAAEGSLDTYEIVYRSKYPEFLKIFEELRQDSVYGVWIFAIIALKDTIQPFVLIYGVSSPYF